MAWKDGYFWFNNENISVVMSKLSQWYDIQVEFKGEIKNELYYAKISRFLPLSHVLRSLEATHTIHFKREGGLSLCNNKTMW